MIQISQWARMRCILLVFTAVLYSSMLAIEKWEMMEQNHQRIISTTTENYHSQQKLNASQQNGNGENIFHLANGSQTVKSIRHFDPSNKSTDGQQEAMFPRWSGGIAIDSLLDAIHVTMSGHLRFDRAHRVYMVNEHGALYQATVPRSEEADDAPYRRAKTMETLALQVLNHVRNTIDEKSTHPYLKMILQHGGFAYISNFADSKFCSEKPPFIDDNWKQLLNHSNVPIFSLSAPIHCQKAFPLPTYETIEHSDLNWPTLIPYYQLIFPRSHQYKQAIWRGGPTGDHEPMKNTRIQLCLKALQRPDILDAKIVKRRRQWRASSKTNESIDYVFDEDHLVGDKVPMVEFQNYRAIIDVDGHSWSSRFGKLLCYSSVVLKVEPEDVDYFHPELQPWVHYIPVMSNLSNLYDMVEFAVTDDPSILEIIKNANQWCLEHLNRPNLIQDMAHIWDRYAYFLLLDQVGDEGLEALSPEQKALASYGAKWRVEQTSLFEEYNFTRVYQ